MATPSKLRRVAWLALPLLAILIFIGPITRGQVLVPADILHLVDDFWKQSGSVQNPLLSDVLFQFYPWQHFLFTQLHHGILPLWNPYILAGTPFLANHQSAPFDIVRLATFFSGFSAAGAFLPAAIARLSIFGIFTALWLRKRGFSLAISLIAAAAAMLAAPNMAWVSYPLFAVFMWLPVVLFGAELVQIHRRAGLLCIAIGTAGHIFSGNIQISLFIGLFTIAYILTLYRKSLAWFIGATVIGLLLSAVQLFPTLTFVRQSGVYETGRSGYATQNILQAAVHNKWIGWHSLSDVKKNVTLLVPLLSPEAFGNPAKNTYGFPYHDGQNNFNELAISVGLGALWLALFGIVTAWKDRAVKFLSISTGVMLGMVAHAPVFELLNYLPFIQQTSTGRFRFFIAFSIVALAAYGMKHLFQSLNRQQRWWLAVTGMIVLIPALAVLVLPQARAPQTLTIVWILLMLIAVCVSVLQKASYRIRLTLLAVALLLPSYFLFHSYNPGVAASNLYPATRATIALQQVAGQGRIVGIASPRRTVPLRPNGSIELGLQDLRGYEVVRLHRFDAVVDGLFTQVVSYRLAIDHVDQRLNMLGVQTGIITSDDPLHEQFLQAGWKDYKTVDGITLMQNPRAFPRAFVVYHPHQVTDKANALAAASAHVQIPSDTVIESGQTTTGQGASAVPATIISDSPNRVVIHTSTGAEGYLVLNDSFDAGWRARVNGRPTKIIPANFTFRAVPLSAGDHTVTFTYQPISFSWGVWVSLVSLVGIATFAFWKKR